MVWGTAIKIVGSLAKKAGPLVKLSRKMPPFRTQGPIPRNKPGSVTTQAAIGVSKESEAIGAQGINQYNDILRQIPEGHKKNELLAKLDDVAWSRINLSKREQLDRAVQELLKHGINIDRGINSRGITEISQIKTYGYWTVKLPQGEIKFGFSYPALLGLSEKLSPITKSRFLSSLEEALRLPQKPGGQSKIADCINITTDKTGKQKDIIIKIGDLKLGGTQWDDGIYTIDTIY